MWRKMSDGAGSSNCGMSNTTTISCHRSRKPATPTKGGSRARSARPHRLGRRGAAGGAEAAAWTSAALLTGGHPSREAGRRRKRQRRAARGTRRKRSGRRARSWKVALQQLLHVLGHYVHLDVDRRAGALRPERGDRRSVRDDGDAERLVVEVEDREADAVHGDRTLLNAIAHQRP